MAYTIVKSDGTVLTTIADGTINTTSTSLGLPGRNYAGYGQALDTNFVHQLENFADSTPPDNPLRGQLWYDTGADSLKICPIDGETNSANWVTLSTTSSAGTTTFGAINVSGNITAGNISVTSAMSGDSLTVVDLTVSNVGTLGNANITTGNIGTLRTQAITSGGTTTAGTVTGTWTFNGTGGALGNAVLLNTGGLYVAPTFGIKCDNYYYANGDPINFVGNYSNANVASYMPVYNGAILATTVTATTLTTGAAANAGTITGNWTLSAGSRFQATYADLAERFASDDVYDAGTVVELGGDHEITAVKTELSEDVFGVISNTAAYLMNAMAGDDVTHPAVAVSGRVKVKATGVIKKGQRLVSAGHGLARAADKNEATAFNTIGRALADKSTKDVGLIEAIVSIK